MGFDCDCPSAVRGFLARTIVPAVRRIRRHGRRGPTDGPCCSAALSFLLGARASCAAQRVTGRCAEWQLVTPGHVRSLPPTGPRAPCATRQRLALLSPNVHESPALAPPVTAPTPPQRGRPKDPEQQAHGARAARPHLHRLLVLRTRRPPSLHRCRSRMAGSASRR